MDLMRNLIATLTAVLLLTHGTAEAQRLRLGDRVPDISISTMLGTHYEEFTSEHICLIFIHSASEPCVVALDEFIPEAESYANDMTIVLLTNEEPTSENALLNGYINHYTSVAFDSHGHTFHTFGINYVPFGVIFDRKKERAEWFGAIHHLKHKTLEEILK